MLGANTVMFNCLIVAVSISRMIQAGSSLIAVHKAKYYKQADGLALGPGRFPNYYLVM